MKWGKCLPSEGERRFKKKFCFFPFKIVVKRDERTGYIQCTETYWFEWVTIKEECVRTRRNAWWIALSCKEGKHESF